MTSLEIELLVAIAKIPKGRAIPIHKLDDLHGKEPLNRTSSTIVICMRKMQLLLAAVKSCCCICNILRQYCKIAIICTLSTSSLSDAFMQILLLQEFCKLTLIGRLLSLDLNDLKEGLLPP